MAERWHWPPESIDNLDLVDLFDHADVARSMFEQQAVANGAPPKDQPQTSDSGRRLKTVSINDF